MPLRFNLTGNGQLAPAGGYPVRLWEGAETMIEGVIGPSANKVEASVYAEAGTVDAHLALYLAPTTVAGADGGRVEDLDPDDATLIVKAYQDDATAIGQTETALLVEVPTNRVRQSYVVRLWVDNITGRVADEDDRDADSSVADETQLPTGAILTSVVVD